jgi:DNA-binding transcriptional ArsR family regulator
MQNYTVETLAKIMKSISHPIRLKILCLLLDGEQTVGQIHARIPTSYANVSQHLQRLQNQGMVVTDKQSNFVHYSLAAPSIREMIGTLRRLYCSEAGGTPPI